MTVRRRGWSGLAVASVAFAALWLFGLGSLVAIVLGLVARRRSPEDRTLAHVGIGLGVFGVFMALFVLARAAAPA